MASPCILLIETESDLAELNETILTEDGYRVEKASPDADPVEVAKKTCPSAIVVGIPYQTSNMWHIVDQLNADQRTRQIPLVVISAVEHTAAKAGATPNVRRTMVMPYDIWGLEKAVASALGHPPAAAVLPKPEKPVPPAQIIAADALSRDARDIVLDALRQIRQLPAYRARFSEICSELVDHLGMMLGAIIGGIGRNLSPHDVFSVPEIQRAIRRHVELRQTQQLGPANAIHEDQILRGTVDQFLHNLVGHEKFTAKDALAVSSIVNSYADELARIIVREFEHGSSS